MRAPDFKLRNLQGVDRSLSGLLAAGPVILAFFKIDCPTCQLTFPFLQRIADRGAQRIVAISQDDVEGTNEFHADFKIRLETLIDGAADRYAVSRAYGLTHVPTIVTVNPDGSIADSFAGFDKARLDQLAGGGLFLDGERVPVFKPG